MRAGKIDIMDTIPTNDAVNMKKTNPTMNEIAVPLGNGLCIDPRDDLAPFTNLNVRIALQEAINLPQIASTVFRRRLRPVPAAPDLKLHARRGLPLQHLDSSAAGTIRL